MKGIIFDLDGVMALTEDVHRQAFDFAFAGFKIDMSRYDWNKDFAGKGHRYIVDTVFGKSPANDSLIDRWVHWYQTIAPSKVKPVPGVIDYINSQSIPMVIATGSARKSAEVVLKALNITLPLVSMEDVSEPKPDPSIFLLASDRIRVKPQDCVVFEDSIYGIRASKSANIPVIALTTTHAREELEAEHPVKIINDFTELLNRNRAVYPQFDER